MYTLKDLRSDLKLTQQGMGELVGVDDTTISKYESGGAKPSIEVLDRIITLSGGKITIKSFLLESRSATSCN